MNSYILIAISAYFLFAFNGVIDKILLTKNVKKPVVYVIYNGLLSAAVIALLPFGVKWLELGVVVVALLAGASFTGASYFYFTAIQKLSISRVLPIQGGFVPLFTLILAMIIVGERLSSGQFLAFLFLTAGAVLISFKKTEGSWKVQGIQYTLFAAFLFSLHFALSKYVYNDAGFISGLFWTRCGMFITACSLLLFKANRQESKDTSASTSGGRKGLFLLSRAAGGAGGILQNLAISMGSVSIVNALQSVQFAAVLLVTSFMSVRYPHLIKETISRNIIVQKLFAIILVVLGLSLLSYYS